MKTVVLGDPPAVLASLLAERKRLGVDTHDELWNGEYHMAPAAAFQHGRVQGLLFRLFDDCCRPLGFAVGLEFNLGELTNFRVPDLGVHETVPASAWVETARVVVEVRSPDDETYEKFGFYFDHGVEEILVVDLVTEAVHWYARGESGFVPVELSSLLGLDSVAVRSAVGW